MNYVNTLIKRAVRETRPSRRFYRIRVFKPRITNTSRETPVHVKNRPNNILKNKNAIRKHLMVFLIPFSIFDFYMYMLKRRRTAYSCNLV